MPNSPRMGLPYPTKDATDWYDEFRRLVLAIDSHSYAHREDRNAVMYSTATWTWDAATGTLEWDDSFWITGAQTGGRWKIQSGSLTIEDGYMMVVSIPRYPQSEDVVDDIEARAACEQTDEGFVVCVRKGNNLYFRTGVVMTSGMSVNIFNVFGGGAPTGSVVEHQQHMHDNGIMRSSTSDGALDVSVVDGGGAADDLLRVAAVPAGDVYYVDGKQRTEPSVNFDYANPVVAVGEVRLYRAVADDAGDPLISQRASYIQPAALDEVLLVNCSRSMGLGAKNLVFTSLVAGSFWQVIFDGGPPLLVSSAGSPQGALRLWSSNGVDWIDVYFAPAWDWTKIDVGGPHSVAITFAPEVNEKDVLLLGTAPVRDVGGFVTWGFGASKDVVDQRYFGNMGMASVRDDLMQSIAEAALVGNISGVVFDQQAAWTGDMSATPAPLALFAQHNFGLVYDGVAGTLEIHGGKILVDGEIVEVPSATLNLNLTLGATDYYVWWDRSDQTIKVTAETAFPTTFEGVQSPLAWILGGNVSFPQYGESWIDKPTRGVPLYVVQRGATDAEINEATLCDLRRNVTKSALKNHISVCIRADWQTPLFPLQTLTPDLNQSEAEFGCLDAAVRYINAVPQEKGSANGSDVGDPSTSNLRSRVIHVLGYTEERRSIHLPRYTSIKGEGYGFIAYGDNALLDTFDPYAGAPPGMPAFLWVGQTSSIRDVYIYAVTLTSQSAAVALDTDANQSIPRTDTVLENVWIFTYGLVGIVGMRIPGDPLATSFSPIVTMRGCSILATDGSGIGSPAYAMYFLDDMQGLNIDGCSLWGDDFAIIAGGAMKGTTISSSVLGSRRIAGGGTPASYPMGATIETNGVDSGIIRDCFMFTQHARALAINGLSQGNLIVDGCSFIGDDISGSAANKARFIDISASPLTFHNCYVYGPSTDTTEVQLNLVYLTSNGVIKMTDCDCYVRGDAHSWSNGVYVTGGGLRECLIKGNTLQCNASYTVDGVPIGISVSDQRVLKVLNNSLYGWAGLGIDVITLAIANDVEVAGNYIECKLAGTPLGNGIRAQGHIHHNRVDNAFSFGIHTTSESRCHDNHVFNVQHVGAARPEGELYFEEYGAWGIRYAPYGAETEIYHLDVHDNLIQSVVSQLENPPNGQAYRCCGIGPTVGSAAAKPWMWECMIHHNDVRNVHANRNSMSNTSYYGIAVSHPTESVSVDDNTIYMVGGSGFEEPWSYGIGTIYGTEVVTIQEYISCSRNKVTRVHAGQIGMGISVPIGSRVQVNENQVIGVYRDAGGVAAIYIYYEDTTSLGLPKEALQFCFNQIGSPQDAIAPGFSDAGIYVQDLNPDDLNGVEVIGNQLVSENVSLTANGRFIAIVADGDGRLIKDNQCQILTDDLTDYAVYVVPVSGTVRNVVVGQNEIWGEAVDYCIEVTDAVGVVIHDNVITGPNDSSPGGGGIECRDCEDIDIHNNLVNGLYPDPVAGGALIMVADCHFGSVHDNVMNGSSAVGVTGLDSLKFLASPGAVNCYELHVHDNKIMPRSDAGVTTFEVNFNGAAADFGTNMTIWANVIGTAAVTGVENFAGTAFYVAAPAANNWTGAAFV